jgi:hypothetical protein
MVLIGLASQGQEKIEFVDAINTTTVKDTLTTITDTTYVQEYKLRVVSEKLFGKNGLYATIEKIASKEKIKTDTILYRQSLEIFLNSVNLAYKEYLKAFTRIDTVRIDVKEVDKKVQELQRWQQKVLNDKEIKNATSLGVWEEKAKELDRYKRIKIKADAKEKKESKTNSKKDTDKKIEKLVGK